MFCFVVLLCPPCKLVASLRFLETTSEITSIWSLRFRACGFVCPQSHDQDLAAAVQSLQGQFQVLQAEKRQVTVEDGPVPCGVGGR